MLPGSEHEYTEYLSARLPRLQRAAYLLCGDRHRAEDIVQATAVRVYDKWKRVRAADNMDAYVHRMLVREFVKQRRHRWSAVQLIDHPPDRPVPPPEDVENRDAVVTALARLPAGQRVTLVLRFLCDMSTAETAAALRCTQGNVKSQTARGLATMRQLISQSNEVTEWRVR